MWIAVALLSGCAERGRFEVLSGATMGTRYRVLVRADEVGPTAARAIINAELAALIDALSTWTEDSEISRFNRDCTQPSGHPMLLAVVAAAQAVFAASGGAFDPSVVPLLELWGFGPGGRRDPGVPTPAAIDAARRQVDFSRIVLQRDATVVCTQAGMRIDVSALGKGYAVDRVHDALKAAGARNLLVEIGGEVRVSGTRASDEPFRIGIERPAELLTDGADPGARARGRELLGARALTGGGVATSGNYRNFFVHERKRYTHIVDPRTGWPVPAELASVSVVADTAMMADAWATALMVLGPEHGPAVARAEGLRALFVLESGEEIVVPAGEAFYEPVESVERGG